MVLTWMLMEKLNKNLFDLSKRYTLITGACGLLGEQHSLALSLINSNLILIDIDEKKGLQLKKKLTKRFKNKIFYFNCNITNKQQIINLKKNLTNLNIAISVIINNASINPQPKNQTKDDNWEDSLGVGLTGAKNIIEVFYKDMIKKKHGNIINIASDLSIIAPDQRIYKSKKYYKPISYSVVKHGMVGITKYYASLLGQYNIRCNCLSPGGVFNNQPKKFVNKLKYLIPLNRMAKKNEYIGAIQFLASDATKYMTGHNLIIDGGRSII